MSPLFPLSMFDRIFVDMNTLGLSSTEASEIATCVTTAPSSEPSYADVIYMANQVSDGAIDELVSFLTEAYELRHHSAYSVAGYLMALHKRFKEENQ